MSNDAILATLTETPQSANDIAAKLGKPVSTVRKWLKRLREAGTIAFQKIGSSIHYYLKAAVEAVTETVTQAVETIREVIKPTRSELRTKVLARAESHRTKMLNSRSSSEARTWKHRYLRATNRAAALA
jgi:DNA-binding transcriptional ArsR family regulator